MSLRVRLLAGVLALFLAALAVVEVVTYLAVRDFLVGRVDTQLNASLRPAAAELNAGGQRAPGGPAGRVPALLPPGTYIELRNQGGQLVESRQVGFGEDRFPPPSLPATFSVLGTNGAPPKAQRFEAGAQSGGTTYRVLAAPAPGNTGTIVLALPLNDVQATLGRLRWIEIGVSAGAALAVFGLGVLAHPAWPSPARPDGGCGRGGCGRRPLPPPRRGEPAD